MVEKILDSLRKDDAVTFMPADEKSIKFVTSMLGSHKFAPIPPEYVDFLKLTDGIIWNGVEFFGTRAIDREAVGYVFPGLIEANLNFMSSDYLKGKLLIGRSSGEIFVYTEEEHKFSIVNRVNFKVNYVYSSFDEMFSRYIDEFF